MFLPQVFLFAFLQSEHIAQQIMNLVITTVHLDILLQTHYNKKYIVRP